MTAYSPPIQLLPPSENLFSKVVGLLKKVTSSGQSAQAPGPCSKVKVIRRSSHTLKDPQLSHSMMRELKSLLQIKKRANKSSEEALLERSYSFHHEGKSVVPDAPVRFSPTRKVLVLFRFVYFSS